jgi:serine/threonine protein kinase
MWSVTQGINEKAAKYAREYSVMPLLLLSLVGPNISFSFLAFGGKIIMDPATPYLSCLQLPFDIPQMIKTARAFRAMKDCIEELKIFYRELSFTEGINPYFEQLRFPYCKSFNYDGSLFHFNYEKQIENKLVFIARIINPTDSVIPKNTLIVVKFTRTYSQEAHQTCFLYKQSAPQFYSCESLKGGWYFIVMEYLEGFECYNPSLYSLHNNYLIKEIVQNLHAHNFVHGDLRGCNILIDLKAAESLHPRICLIDFDWSGEADITRYPAFMNHKEVIWAKDASDFLPLKKAHDVHFLDIFESSL